uniref:solute carrier family 23 member 3 isoform X4 n=1 Tax=Callithrix jacchus TaxID=9483 RepID=UPI0023DD13FC|nr:solute carrier family 23 member 3 isoform X4 [Callithrix jacchus]
MSRSPLNPNQLRSVGSQDALASLPPPAPQNPSTHSWDPLCGSLPWSLSCLLALQHVLVVASLLCVSHLLLLYNLPPGGLSYSPSQLLASSFFSCGVSTILQTWMGSRLPLVQAPSLEFLIPALMLTSQKLPLAIQTPGNSSLMLHLCRGPSCHGLGHWNTSLQEVGVWRYPGQWWYLGCCRARWGCWGVLAACSSTVGPWYWPPAWLWQGSLPTGRWPSSAPLTGDWPCWSSCLWWSVLSTWAPARFMCVPGGKLQPHQLPILSLPSGSSHLAPQVLIPVACVWIISAFVGFSVIPQELSDPTKAPWIWLPHPGGVLGVTQAVVLSAGFSSFYLADIDSGRNIFIVGFSIFMALLLPRWFRETPILFSTGWSPLDVLLHSLLTQPIFLAGLSGFLLENTIPGTQLERGLSQGLPSPFTAQEARMPQKSREKAAQVYRLPFHIQNLCLCIPQPLRCLCPLPEDPGDEEGGSSEPEEMADLLPGSGEPCPESSREGFRSQK